MDIQSQLEAIPIGNGYNAFQLLFWLLAAFAAWMYFGDKIKAWFQSFAASAGSVAVAQSPATLHGIDALHATLTTNGWTAEEADKLVADNVTRIRIANESKK